MMTVLRTNEYLSSLVREFCKLPYETEWIEFKTGNEDPEAIGEYLSALSNAATIAGKPSAYLVWGIDDDSHTLVGTAFEPRQKKIGNEELENWLIRLLSPRIHFQFSEVVMEEGQRIVLLQIQSAFGSPVLFRGQAYIRLGTSKKKLRDVPAMERALWRAFDKSPFETGIAAEHLGDSDVLSLLDYPTYFDMLKIPLPEDRKGILESLANDRLICPCEAGGWNITNLGAALFAKRLDDFQTLRRKAVRVIHYLGTDRTRTLKEQQDSKGYASGFERVIDLVTGLLPSNEVIEQGLRRTVSMYPEDAIRELVANALVHQDFFITGAGPMIEIFSDRVEITNPGKPLVKTERFLDNPPRSRNEAFASLLRRMGICEERGSGWDKVVSLTENFLLPPPLAEAPGENTRVVLFAPRPLPRMDKDDRMRAVYLHACLRYVNRDYLTNTSLRLRFNIAPQNSATASRLIAEALEARFIQLDDPSAAHKLKRYVPFWAREEDDGI